jgi:hypothetical protein
MIREALMSPHRQELPLKIEYLVPWSEEKTIPPGTMDVILSHSVLEHVADLPATYRAFHSWLKPGGYCTHQIDFTSHDPAAEWNRHWAYPPGLWRIILGRRRYFINRSPGSVHLSLLQEQGFRITCCLKRHRYDGIQRQQLSANWRQLSDDDLTCSGLFVQAQKE